MFVWFSFLVRKLAWRLSVYPHGKMTTKDPAYRCTFLRCGRCHSFAGLTDKFYLKSWLFSMCTCIVISYTIILTKSDFLNVIYCCRWLITFQLFLTGRVDNYSFFDCSSPFSFLLIEFHSTFSISYRIVINYVYFYCILIWIVFADGTSFLFRARFTSFHTHLSLLTFFLSFFVLFHSCCSHARVFGKTLVHEFLISYNHTEWY